MQLAHMGARGPWRLALLLVCFLFSPGPCISGKPPSEAVVQKQISNTTEKRILFSQLDDVPVVNPTTPDTGNPSPFANPTPTPQGPFTTGPNPTNSGPPQGENPTTPTTTNPPTTPASSGGTWCIAGPSADPTALQVALDYACGYGGADCSALQSGASCYDPNTVRDHASYAFNDYYQKHPAPTSCVFGGTAQITNTDPSHGNCHFTSSTTQSTPPPTFQSPPSPAMPMTPVNPTTPSMTVPGGAGYGFEPTESPNSAISVSYSMGIIISTISLWGSLFVGSCI